MQPLFYDSYIGKLCDLDLTFYTNNTSYRNVSHKLFDCQSKNFVETHHLKITYSI